MNKYVSEKCFKLIMRALWKIKENVLKPYSAAILIPLAHKMLTAGVFYAFFTCLKVTDFKKLAYL